VHPYDPASCHAPTTDDAETAGPIDHPFGGCAMCCAFKTFTSLELNTWSAGPAVWEESVDDDAQYPHGRDVSLEGASATTSEMQDLGVELPPIAIRVIRQQAGLGR
jgi:hypothetical protein